MHLSNGGRMMLFLDAHDPIFRIACVVCNSLGIGAFVPMECFLCTWMHRLLCSVCLLEVPLPSLGELFLLWATSLLLCCVLCVCWKSLFLLSATSFLFWATSFLLCCVLCVSWKPPFFLWANSFLPQSSFPTSVLLRVFATLPAGIESYEDSPGLFTDSAACCCGKKNDGAPYLPDQKAKRFSYGIFLLILECVVVRGGNENNEIFANISEFPQKLFWCDDADGWRPVSS